MRKVFAFALASVLATPAMAQSVEPRVELQGGYDSVKLGLQVDGTQIEDTEDGLAYGAEIGFDVPVASKFKVGPYAGTHFSDTEYCEGETGSFDYCVGIGRNFSAGIQLTAEVAPKVDLFAKVGYANGRLTADYVDYEDPEFSESDSIDRDALQLGAGARFALGENLYAGAQLVYSNYKDEDATIYGSNVSAHGSRINVLGSLGYRF